VGLEGQVDNHPDHYSPCKNNVVGGVKLMKGETRPVAIKERLGREGDKERPVYKEEVCEDHQRN